MAMLIWSKLYLSSIKIVVIQYAIYLAKNIMFKFNMILLSLTN